MANGLIKSLDTYSKKFTNTLNMQSLLCGGKSANSFTVCGMQSHGLLLLHFISDGHTIHQSERAMVGLSGGIVSGMVTVDYVAGTLR